MEMKRGRQKRKGPPEGEGRTGEPEETDSIYTFAIPRTRPPDAPGGAPQQQQQRQQEACIACMSV
jgi:hypothetical protein